ncbi:MAG: cell division protein FtsL [Clostridia bacterium]|nr:cell division protein FtsL [Clostridia bacterium]
MAVTKYQYGTSPRKVYEENKKAPKEHKKKMHVVKDIQRQDIKVSAEQRKKQVKITLAIIAAFITLLTISYRNSQINEQFSKVQNLKKDLATLQKENEQLKVSIENGQNANNIEKEAKEKLGMKKLTSKQTVYVSLPKEDYVETASTTVVIEQHEEWYEKILNKIFNKE